jgi:heme oxygenase
MMAKYGWKANKDKGVNFIFLSLTHHNSSVDYSPYIFYIKPPGPMILNKLKVSTQGFHRLSENLNYSDDLRNGTITKEKYGLSLKRLYGFYSQVNGISKQNKLENNISKDLFDKKINLLNSDLTALGMSAGPAHLVFEKVDEYEYIGFCYVSIGSMLGARIIHRNLLQMQSCNNIQLPCMFYKSCWDLGLAEWKSLTQYISSLDITRHDSVINGAKLCYLYFIYLCAAIQ